MLNLLWLSRHPGQVIEAMMTWGHPGGMRADSEMAVLYKVSAWGIWLNGMGGSVSPQLNAIVTDTPKRHH